MGAQPPDRRMVWLLAAAAVVLGLSYGACTQDDAFISFRYAENLVRGDGLVFNPGERVEGYTNLSWTLLIAGAMTLGAEPVIASTLLGLVCLAGVVVATWRLGLGGGPAALVLVAPMLVAVDAQLALESVEGLETALYVWLITLGTGAAIREERWAGSGWFVLACLTRPEGIFMWGAVQVGLLLRAWTQQAVGAQLRATWRSALPVLACLAALTAWRLAYYGDPLPNTFYAKTGALAVPRGLHYLWAHVVSHPLLWLLVGARLVAGRRTASTLPLATAACLYLTYVVLIGGDFKPTGRFIVPVLPMLAVLAQEALAGLVSRGARLRWSAVGVAAVVGVWGSLDQYRVAAGHGAERHANLEARKLVGDWIATHTPPDTVIAIHSAGVIPFYAGRRTIDMWGLTDRTIARTRMQGMGTGMAGHEKTNPAYVFSRDPDLYLPEDKVFTLRAWSQPVEEGFPADFAARYRSVSVPIEGRYLNMWVRRGGG